MPSGGDQELVRRHGAAARQLEGEGAVVVLADTVGSGVKEEVDAVRPQPGGDQRGGLFGEGAQQAAAGHEGHRGAQPGEGLGEFGAGDAAAQDRQPVRDLARGGRLPGGPVVHVRQAFDGRHRGRGPGGQHDGVPCRECVAVAVQSRDFDLPGVRDPAVAADELDSGVLDPLDLAVILPVGREVVAAFQDSGCVQSAGDGLCGAGHGLGAVQGGAGAQQRLGGHAGPVGTLAAHQFGLDQHRGQPALHDAVRHVFAHGAGADHNDIEFPFKLCRHGKSLRPAPGRRPWTDTLCRTWDHRYCWEQTWGRAGP